MLNSRNVIYCVAAVMTAFVTAIPITAAAGVIRERTLRSAFPGLGQSFGASVTIGDRVALIGEPFGGTGSTGTAQLFEVDSGRYLGTLTASDPSYVDLFGASVAISGNSLLVGAPNNDSAYLFDIETRRQRFKLTPSDVSAYFGNSVALSDAVAVIGAYWADGFSGAAYVFDVSSGQELFKLTASDSFRNARFGETVAIDGNIAVIGGAHNALESPPGSAYVFDLTSGQELLKLQSPGAINADGFGDSLAIHENLAIVGSWGNRAAYVFDVTTGRLLTTLLSPNVPNDGSFGRWVTIRDGVAFVSGMGRTGRANEGIYAFDAATGQELFSFDLGESLESSIFGHVHDGRLLAASGNKIIVGTAGKHNGETVGQGTAHVFSFQVPLLGDTDADGDIDIDDLNNVRNNFGATGPSDGTLPGDAFPFDGFVNIDDLNNVRNSFGNTAGVAGIVPEPGGLGLAVLALVFGTALIPLRRKRRHERLCCDVPYG
jgi:outer membrane protein assembly factor BamB